MKWTHRGIRTKKKKNQCNSMVLLVLRSLFVYSVRLGSRSVYLFIFSYCIFVFYFHSISCMSKSYRSECIMSILRFIFLFVSRILRNYVPISSKKVPFFEILFLFLYRFWFRMHHCRGCTHWSFPFILSIVGIESFNM